VLGIGTENVCQFRRQKTDDWIENRRSPSDLIFDQIGYASVTSQIGYKWRKKKTP
jgi:hypothetical protein